jgi:carboxyl-terminal processing protease
VTKEGLKPEEQSGKVKSSKIGLAIIGILIIFILGYFFGYLSGTGGVYTLSLFNTPNFNILNEAAQKIRSQYVGKYNQEDLTYGALEGMLLGLGDPYSGIIRADNIEDFYQEIEGEFEGIGIEIAKKEGEIVIIAPLEGYPAEKKGILAGDKIVEVDHESISTSSLDEVVNMIRG